MKRREFLKTAATLAVLGTAAKLAGAAGAGETAAAAAAEQGGIPDLVAVRGGSPAAMFDRAIRELGGMERFVKKGQSVTIKPNIGWDQGPEMAANTNPELVKRIVEACFAAGAARVRIFDTTCNFWKDCYQHSGIQQAAEKAGAEVVGGDSARDENYKKNYYAAVPVTRSKILPSIEQHKFVRECDVLINVPVLKVHSGAALTCCMKNLMGTVSKDCQRLFHRTGLQKCIAACASVRKPDLNIVDAYRVMTKRGPRGVDASDVRQLGYLMAGTDMVALDTAGAKLLGVPLDRIGHIAEGEALGLGTSDLTKLKIKRIKI